LLPNRDHCGRTRPASASGPPAPQRRPRCAQRSASYSSLGAEPGVLVSPRAVSGQLCGGVSFLYCGYRRLSDKSPSGKSAQAHKPIFCRFEARRIKAPNAALVDERSFNRGDPRNRNPHHYRLGTRLVSRGKRTCSAAARGSGSDQNYAAWSIQNWRAKWNYPA